MDSLKWKRFLYSAVLEGYGRIILQQYNGKPGNAAAGMNWSQVGGGADHTAPVRFDYSITSPKVHC